MYISSAPAPIPTSNKHCYKNATKIAKLAARLTLQCQQRLTAKTSMYIAAIFTGSDRTPNVRIRERKHSSARMLERELGIAMPECWRHS